MSEDVFKREVCEGLDLLVLKCIPERKIEFHLNNSTEFIFLFTFDFTELSNLVPANGETSMEIEVFPNSNFKFTELVIEGSFSYKYHFKYQKLNPQTKVKNQPIADNLTLQIQRTDLEQKITFRLCNYREESVKIELSFFETDGIVNPEDQKMTYTALAESNTETDICDVYFEGEWKYKYTYKIWLSDSEPQSSYLMECYKSLHLTRNLPLETLSFEFLSRVFGDDKFTDPFFMPSELSLSTEVDWKRLGGFQLYTEFHESQIIPGFDGSPWFLCPLAAFEQPLIKSLIENLSTNENGIYRVKLCIAGEWTPVVIDDYLPWFKDDQAVFSTNLGEEIWASLLIKAYAKSHGCFESLVGVKGALAFTVLTGCPAFTYPFSVDNLWNQIWDWKTTGCSVVATLESEDGNGYFSVEAMETVQEVHLVKLKNSWCDLEWLADLSESSSLWTPGMRESLKHTLDSKEKSFWMSVDSLHKVFSNLVVGKGLKYHQTKKKTLLDIQSKLFQNYWEVTVSEKTHVILGVHQEDTTSLGSKTHRKLQDLSLVVFNQDKTFQSASSRSGLPESIYWEAELQPGKYYLVPVSSGEIIDSKTKPFEVCAQENLLSPQLVVTLKDIFRKLDTKCLNLVSYEDFKEFYSRVWGEITLEEFKVNIINKYSSTEQDLTFQGFLELFQEVLWKEGFGGLVEVLKKVGYTEQLESVETKPLVLSAHSSSQIVVSALDFSQSLEEYTWTSYITERGYLVLAQDQVFLSALDCCSGSIFLLVNKNPQKVSAELSFTSPDLSAPLSSTIALEPLGSAIIKQFRNLLFSDKIQVKITVFLE